jgi:hypothetical protein
MVLTQLDLNFRFNVSVVYLRLIILLVVDDVRCFLTDFVNIKLSRFGLLNVLIVYDMYMYIYKDKYSYVYNHL